jgi:serine/threonine protein kinase
MARSASVPPETPGPGTPHTVAGRFRLDFPIGRGGAGVVWRGEDEVLQRPVAVKEILVPLAGAQKERDTLRKRVLREARALARLNNPSIVAIYDVEEEAERFWIIMELVDAESLGDVIRNYGPLPPEQVAAIGLELVEALTAAHQKGVLHRDVKPGNVLLGRDGRVRLTDFGIAATEGDMTLTGTGALVGSPAYIAPERIRGSSGSPASDLWGLAATLYSAVEGTPPFEGPETYAVLSAVVEGRRRPFHNAGPLRSLLSDLLDHEAEDRPSTDEIRQRLQTIARDHEPVPAFVVNGPDAADDDVAPDGGLEHVDDVAPAAPGLDDDLASSRSDELAGLEAVSDQPPFLEDRRVGHRRPSTGRGALLFAAAAAVVVIGAAVAVTLLLIRHDKGSDLRQTSLTGGPSAAATGSSLSWSPTAGGLGTGTPAVVRSNDPGSSHASTEPTVTTSPSAPAGTPPTHVSATPSTPGASTSATSKPTPSASASASRSCVPFPPFCEATRAS